MSETCWVVYWSHERFEEHSLEEDENVRWTCNEATREGDLALLYVRAPTSSLVALFEATSDAKKSKWALKFGSHPWACQFDVVSEFYDPLSLADMRHDRELWDAWGLVRANFQPGGGRPPRVSDDVCVRLAKRIPELRERFDVEE